MKEYKVEKYKSYPKFTSKLVILFKKGNDCDTWVENGMFCIGYKI
jgi:hypothetical protein